jgi:hypothetical protein
MNLPTTTSKGAAVNAEQRVKPQSRRTATAASNRTGAFATLRAFLRGARGSGAPAAGRPEGTGALSASRRLAMIAAAVGVVAVAMGLFLTATPAQAASPWWHLTSGTRPTYIDPNAGEPGIPGEPEIQEIVARFIPEEEVGAFATEPAALRGFGAPA